MISVCIHPDHKPGRGRHKGTLYKCTRNPDDLGYIHVFDHHRNISVRVEAVRLDYAGGLTLHQHSVIVAHHKRIVGEFVDVDGLLRVRAGMLEKIREMRKQRDAEGTERKLARFLGAQKAKRIRSRVEPANVDEEVSSQPLDVFSPVGVRKPEARSLLAPDTTRRRRAGDPRQVRRVDTPEGERPKLLPRPRLEAPKAANSTTGPAAVPDMDHLRARHSDWEP